MNNLIPEQTDQIRNLIDQAKEVLILLPSNPPVDFVAASLSLYLSLISRGKQVNVTCPSAMTVEFNHLIGVDKISNKINSAQGRNLVISFPYQEGAIEKVSYNIEDNFFNLVIEPRKDFSPITPEAIKYSSSGGNIDLIFTIGITGLSEINNLSNIKELINEKPIVNIDINPQNNNFGRINIVNQNLSSTCEILISLFSSLSLNIDADIASNLLMGITFGSNNFSSPQTSASTFEAAAVCLKHGAQIVKAGFQKEPIAFPKLTNTSLKTTALNTNIPASTPVTPVQTNTLNQPSMRPSFMKPQPKIKIFSPNKRPVNTIGDKPISDTPPDWLKPKIYKGSTLL